MCSDVAMVAVENLFVVKKTIVPLNLHPSFAFLISDHQLLFVLQFSDFEHVISHHIQHDDFPSALDVLTKQVFINLSTSRREPSLLQNYDFKMEEVMFASKVV